MSNKHTKLGVRQRQARARNLQMQIECTFSKVRILKQACEIHGYDWSKKRGLKGIKFRTYLCLSSRFSFQFNFRSNSFSVFRFVFVFVFFFTHEHDEHESGRVLRLHHRRRAARSNPAAASGSPPNPYSSKLLEPPGFHRLRSCSRLASPQELGFSCGFLGFWVVLGAWRRWFGGCDGKYNLPDVRDDYGEADLDSPRGPPDLLHRHPARRPPLRHRRRRPEGILFFFFTSVLLVFSQGSFFPLLTCLVSSLLNHFFGAK